MKKYVHAKLICWKIASLWCPCWVFFFSYTYNFHLKNIFIHPSIFNQLPLNFKMYTPFNCVDCIYVILCQCLFIPKWWMNRNFETCGINLAPFKLHINGQTNKRLYSITNSLYINHFSRKTKELLLKYIHIPSTCDSTRLQPMSLAEAAKHQPEGCCRKPTSSIYTFFTKGATLSISEENI